MSDGVDVGNSSPTNRRHISYREIVLEKRPVGLPKLRSVNRELTHGDVHSTRVTWRKIEKPHGLSGKTYRTLRRGAAAVFLSDIAGSLTV